MKVLIDTNLTIDVLAKRAPFYEKSAQILHLSEIGQIKGHITANSVTDIIYILRKYIADRHILSSVVQNLSTIVQIIKVGKKDIGGTFNLELDGILKITSIHQ